MGHYKKFELSIPFYRAFLALSEKHSNYTFRTNARQVTGIQSWDSTPRCMAWYWQGPTLTGTHIPSTWGVSGRVVVSRGWVRAAAVSSTWLSCTINTLLFWVGEKTEDWSIWWPWSGWGEEEGKRRGEGEGERWRGGKGERVEGRGERRGKEVVTPCHHNQQ